MYLALAAAFIGIFLTVLMLLRVIPNFEATAVIMGLCFSFVAFQATSLQQFAILLALSLFGYFVAVGVLQVFLFKGSSVPLDKDEILRMSFRHSMQALLFCLLFGGLSYWISSSI